MKRISQAGFSIVEALLVVIILAMIGFVGWFIWHSNRNTDQTLNQTNKSSKTQVLPKSSTVVRQTIKSGAVAGAKVQQTKLSQLPDLSTAVVTHLKAINGCLDPSGHIINEAGQTDDPTVFYVAGNSARVAACQSNELYAELNNVWTYVATTQGSYKCSDLQKYKIPMPLIAADAAAKASCADNSHTVTYTD